MEAKRVLTLCPIPVRLVARISTFHPESSIEVLDVCAMPGQELGCEVDLHLRLMVVRGE